MIVKRRNVFKVVVLICSALSMLVLNFSCSFESNELVRQKLNLILPDDMKGIVEGIPPNALIEKPHYEISSYKKFKKGMYSVKAEVDFYFLKKVDVKIVRKFRYHRSKKMWERYFNEYRYTSDTTVKK
jgi:hypothetical protein